ncbi:hypothetical protein CRENBAI_017238 [Crenichthys baileyi]|uniref:Uncharacterized protein n=1 Tax=Crenichthys baileyi TaxID=28760 RepID=A0AAV9QYX1_9TELE
MQSIAVCVSGIHSRTGVIKYEHCLTLSPSPADAHGVREKPLQRRGLPVGKEDSRDRITVVKVMNSWLTDRTSRLATPSYGANPLTQIERPATAPRLPKAKRLLTVDTSSNFAASDIFPSSWTSDVYDKVPRALHVAPQVNARGWFATVNISTEEGVDSCPLDRFQGLKGMDIIWLLPSGLCYRALSAKTSHHRDSFFPLAVSLMNT